MIRFVNQDGLAVVTIDRPGKANSLTGRMLRDLTAAFDQIAVADIDHGAREPDRLLGVERPR